MQPFTRPDRLWLLALPLYLFLLILRHEASHAVAILAVDHGEVTEISLLPTISQREGFVRPRVGFRGHASWPTLAAPYFSDLLFFSLCLPVCAWGLRRSMPKAVWINVAVIGVASPLLNSFGNYVIGLFRSRSDIGRLLVELPAAAVHAYFWVTLAVYALGTGLLIRTAHQQTLVASAEDTPS